MSSIDVNDKDVIVEAFQKAYVYKLKNKDIDEAKINSVVEEVVISVLDSPIPQKVEPILDGVNEKLDVNVQYDGKDNLFKIIAHELKDAGYSERVMEVVL